MEKPRVAVLGSKPDTARAIAAQMEMTFAGLVIFDPYDFPSLEKTKTRIQADFALIASSHILEKSRRYLSKSVKTLVTDRVINVDAINELYDIPEGSDVLLVNNMQGTTMESIKQLQAVGLNHVTYHPYYPGLDGYRKDCSYVVTFDEADLIPESFCKKVIDLGPRPVDLTTIIDLATQLGIYNKVKNTLSAAFLKSSLDVSRNINTRLKANQVLKNKLDAILGMFESGVLTFDENYELSYFNNKADILLKISENEHIHLKNIIDTIKEKNKFFIAIKDKNYYVEVNSYEIGQSSGFIVEIDETQKIEAIEKNYRIYSHKKGFSAEYTFAKIFHTSQAMKKVLLQAKQFAKSNSNILIEGESGCGKELFAQAIHNESARRQHPFVAVNFAALSETLCESELFGHEEGAFTGARKGGKKGLFEEAHKGTIFLDEIGDAPVSIQKKILRVLQERRIMPIGSNQLIPIDVRIIAATNQNLWDMACNGAFRQDLYYRLKVLPLFLPPLRERKEDIVPAFFHFLTHVFRVDEHKLRGPAAASGVPGILLGHQWPGNMRELRNVAEYVSNLISFDADWAAQLSGILYNTTDSQDSQTLLTKLEEHGPAEELLRVLRALDRPPFVFGRRELEQILAPVSQGSIKKNLAALKKLGLINSRTGYGSYLLEAGKKLCRDRP